MDAKYHFNVNMYNHPPDGIEDLMKLVEIAEERLKLYQILQNIELFTPIEEIKVHLEESILSCLLEKTESCTAQEARRIDDISHWILRIAYNDRLEFRLFIKYELDWFKIRFNSMEDAEKLKFMRDNNFVLMPLTDEEKLKLGLEQNICYKIKFSEIHSLVNGRQYPLHDGHLYIPFNGVVYWLLNKLERNLRISSAHIRKVLPSIDEDQLKTLMAFLDLVKPLTIKFTIPKSIMLEELDEEAKLRFPLCMKFQHETLRRTHHLKYFSRMQYGLFLKGLGLTLEQSLHFWRDEFTNEMSEERFKRRYSYLFRHQYGAVGSKTNYRPFSCKRIMNQPVGPNQIHGCPYKHWDEDNLRTKLREYKITEGQVNSIMELKAQNRYTRACAVCLESVSSCKLDRAIIHPNQYYEISYNTTKCADRDIEDFFGSDSE